MSLSPERHELLSIVGLSLATLFVMNGYDTSSFVTESVLHSVHARSPEKIDAYAGYYGQTVLYGAYAISTIITPWISYKIGAKWTLFTGSIFFTLYLAGFFHLNAYFFYTSQVLQGIGYALYYSGQGQYMSEHSTRKTISRNSVIVSAIGNQSMLLGGLSLILIYLASPPPTSPAVNSRGHTFRIFGDTEIYTIFSALVASSIVSNILFAFLPTKQHDSIAQQEPVHHATFTNQIHLLWDTLKEPRILALLPFFIFYGLHVSIWLIIYPTSFAFSHHLAHNHFLPALFSISIGIGNLIVGFFIQHMSKRNPSFGLMPTMLTQLIFGIGMYTLTVLSTPNTSTMMPTNEDAMWFNPSTISVLVIGVLHGMMDCSSCTMRAFVCTVAVPKKRLQAYSVAKCFQSLATCFGTFIAADVSIYQWAMILIGSQLLSATCFFGVCRQIQKGENAKIIPEVDSSTANLQELK